MVWNLMLFSFNTFRASAYSLRLASTPGAQSWSRLIFDSFHVNPFFCQARFITSCFTLKLRNLTRKDLGCAPAGGFGAMARWALSTCSSAASENPRFSTSSFSTKGMTWLGSPSAPSGTPYIRTFSLRERPS